MSETAKLPHNEELERSIIAAVMMEPGLVDTALSRGVCNDMFFSRRLRILWAACVSLSASAGHVDIVLLDDELKGQSSEFDGDVTGYLLDVMNAIASTAGFRSWVTSLKRLYAARQLLKACSGCSDNISAGEPISSVVVTLQDHVNAAERAIDGKERRSTVSLIRSVVEEAQNGVSEKKAIIPVCIPGTEALLHRKKNLHIIGAMPGVGKTAFALNSMLGRAKAGFTDCLFCAETSAESLMKRLISIEAELPIELFDDFNKINHSQLGRYKDAVMTMKDLKERIYIFGKGDYRHSPEGIRSELKRIQDELSGGLDSVTVDYLQNMRARGNLAKANRAEQIEEFIFSLNETFGELNLAATVLCQLSRDKDRIKGNKAPNIYDLKGSSAIEQEADFITFLHKENPLDSGLIEILWYSAKIRGSKIIYTRLGYDTSISKYKEPPHRYDTADLPEDVNSKRPYKEN